MHLHLHLHLHRLPCTHAADKAPSAPQIIHKVNMFLLGAAPVALATSPSVVSFPLDLVMGVAIPVHMHIGMNGVISDYVPKSAQTTARIVLLVVSGVTLLGLMKLNLAGDGISETAKALWRKPAAKEEGH